MARCTNTEMNMPIGVPFLGKLDPSQTNTVCAPYVIA